MIFGAWSRCEWHKTRRWLLARPTPAKTGWVASTISNYAICVVNWSVMWVFSVSILILAQWDCASGLLPVATHGPATHTCMMTMARLFYIYEHYHWTAGFYCWLPGIASCVLDIYIHCYSGSIPCTEVTLANEYMSHVFVSRIIIQCCVLSNCTCWSGSSQEMSWFDEHIHSAKCNDVININIFNC